MENTGTLQIKFFKTYNKYKIWKIKNYENIVNSVYDFDTSYARVWFKNGGLV